jgi:NhaP-type Na+/H+ or K+/H+ antiporter
VVAIAGVSLCYGGTELLEGYGFVATFVAGITLRRFEMKHRFHRTLHSFVETIEHSLTALLLVALGAAIPALWPQTNWAHFSIGLILILIIRPLAGYISLAPTHLRGRQRAVVAFYGVRGIGSIYYIAYASSQLDLLNESGLWSTVALTIFASTIIHGLTAGLAIEDVTQDRRENPTDRHSKA